MLTYYGEIQNTDFLMISAWLCRFHLQQKWTNGIKWWKTTCTGYLGRLVEILNLVTCIASVIKMEAALENFTWLRSGSPSGISNLKYIICQQQFCWLPYKHKQTLRTGCQTLKHVRNSHSQQKMTRLTIIYVSVGKSVIKLSKIIANKMEISKGRQYSNFFIPRHNYINWVYYKIWNRNTLTRKRLIVVCVSSAVSLIVSNPMTINSYTVD